MAPADDPDRDRGDESVPEPPRADPVVGEFVTETFDYDGGRKVTVYLPPDRPEAVVFAGDGQLISGWGACLEAAGTVPTMIVGAHRVTSEDEMLRLGEYSPPIDPARFAAHEQFFVHSLRGWVRSRFGAAPPAERTAVAGVSASAELSLAMGMRHPDRYHTVFAASPGAGYRPPAVMPKMLPRAYLTAGTLEPFFLEKRKPLGRGPADRRRGCRHERARRQPWRPILASRVRQDGALGVRLRVSPERAGGSIRPTHSSRLRNFISARCSLLRFIRTLRLSACALGSSLPTWNSSSRCNLP